MKEKLLLFIISLMMIPTLSWAAQNAIGTSATPIGYVAYSVNKDLYGKFCNLPLTGGATVIGASADAPSAGGVIIDDTYYSFIVDDEYSWFGFYQYYLVAWNADTFEYDSTKTLTLDNSTYENWVIACTKTADDKIFALTHDFDGNGIQFAKYTISEDGNVTREKVADAAHDVICMTSAADGTIYAITYDNALYTIDASTGAMTKIGNTGFKAADKDGAYGQSMCYDNKNKQLYWFAFSADATQSPIFSLDTATGAATKLSTDDAPLTQVFGAVIPDPKAEDGAPAAISDLKVLGDGASLTKNVQFTAPTMTFDGETSFTGDLAWTIYINGKAKESGTCAAGDIVSCDVELAPGTNAIYATTTNEVGQSPKSNKISIWAGLDTPHAPTNVNLSIADDGKATLTWSQVTESEHDGYMGNITYNIMDGENVIASEIADTTYTWNISLGSKKTYCFDVIAVNDTMKSAAATSNIVVAGSSIEVPAVWGNTETGFSKSDYAMFSVIDANNDGKTWCYSSSASTPFHYNYSETNAADDWAFSPKISVKAGKTYIIKYIATSQSDYLPETMEVKLGNNATVEAMTTTAVEAYNTTTALKEKVIEYQAEADGNLVIGFHAISAANAYYLNLWKVSVENGPDLQAPAAVSDLVITPGANGAKNAAIKFTAPARNIAGTSVAPLTKVEILCNESLVTTITDVTAGESVSYNTTVTENGLYTFKVIAYNEFEYGQAATASAYIGMDIPDLVYDAYLTDNVTSIDVNWTKVGNKGQNGGYVNPAKVTYELYDLTDGYINSKIGEGVDINTFTIKGVNTDEGDPGLLQYALRTANEAGKSSYMGTGAILVGAPVETPLTESFAGGETENYWWVDRTGSGGWGISTYEGGYATFSQANAGDKAWMGTAKLNVKNISNPGIVVETKMTAGAKLSISAMTRNSAEKVLGTFEGTAEKEDSAKWESHLVMIPEDLVNADYVCILLKGEATKNSPRLFVRNFMVRDIINDDLSLALTASAGVTKGKNITGNVTITNQGKNAAANYSVKVTCGNEIVMDSTVTAPLVAYNTLVIPFTIKTSIFDRNDATTIAASVTYAKDLDEDNNVDEVEVELADPTAVPVSDLAAEQTDEGVVLTWNALETEAVTVTEDFEDYDNQTAAPYTKNSDELYYFTEWNKVGKLGPWTAYDLDGGTIYGWSSDLIHFDLKGDAMGFVVIDHNDTFGDASYEELSSMSHSGTKVLYCMDVIPETGGPEHNDDWLVSPELSGNAQTISFYANEISDEYGHESFEILYSTTDIDTDSFTKLYDGNTDAAKGWQQYSYNLPEGTKYFAIRVTSADIFGMLIDDITYETVSDTPVSFNIYRDSEKVASTAEKTYTYAETVAGTHTYSVSAVYANGDESAPQSVTIEASTGINPINGETAGQDIIFRLDGVKVKKAQRGVHIINGKTAVVK